MSSVTSSWQPKRDVSVNPNAMSNMSSSRSLGSVSSLLSNDSKIWSSRITWQVLQAMLASQAPSRGTSCFCATRKRLEPTGQLTGTSSPFFVTKKKDTLQKTDSEEVGYQFHSFLRRSARLDVALTTMPPDLEPTHWHI